MTRAPKRGGGLSVVDFWDCDVPQEFSVATTVATDLSAFALWLGAMAFRVVRA